MHHSNRAFEPKCLLYLNLLCKHTFLVTRVTFIMSGMLFVMKLWNFETLFISTFHHLWCWRPGSKSLLTGLTRAMIPYKMAGVGKSTGQYTIIHGVKINISSSNFITPKQKNGSDNSQKINKNHNHMCAFWNHKNQVPSWEDIAGKASMERHWRQMKRHPTMLISANGDEFGYMT